MPREITVEVVVRLPEPPDFLLMTDGTQIDIADVSDTGLQELGDAWTEYLIDRAQERRDAREED